MMFFVYLAGAVIIGGALLFVILQFLFLILVLIYRFLFGTAMESDVDKGGHDA